MRGRTRLAAGVFVTAIFVAALTACSHAGDLAIMNEGTEDVTVLTGDEEAEVSVDGGVVLLDYGCTPGDVTVEFASGQVVVVPGPVCSEQRVVIRDGEIGLEPVE